MKDMDLFALYGLVQKKDKDAEDELMRRHSLKYPRNDLNKSIRGVTADYRNGLHAMYLHLYK